MSEQYDLIVIGSGAAGLSTALGSGGALRVAVISRGVSGLDGASCWAQGGIAAAVGPGDSAGQHAADTISAGARLNNKSAVRWLAESAPDVVRWLLALGMQFDSVNGRLSLGREAAHSFPRILHAGGDATGAELARVLRETAARQPWIESHEFTDACELLKRGNQVVGVLARNRRGEQIRLLAPSVVLATGGIGQLYRFTSNPAEADGSGLALAHQAGAELADLEFVQFHPTALAPKAEDEAAQLPLITEALRGAGCQLLNDQGARFMAAASTQGELAPRDVVARAVWDQLAQGRRVFLDARGLGDSVRSRFPNFVQSCAQRGIDPRTHLVPIVPAAHYHMGGVKVDLHSMSRVPGLYAVGEVACTGVHGANRLASNSLLEALAFGKALGERLAQRGPVAPITRVDPVVGQALRPMSTNDQMILGRLRQIMWNDVGIVRTTDGMQSALHQIQVLERRCLPGAPVLRQLLAARLIVEAGLHRRDSLGAHFIDNNEHNWSQRQGQAVA
ncbi:MAG: L-aspartate oxidase [Rhodanobacteraceae bacterium]|nr:L-aspartate oxidase [Rhodanobacteraceae bacterium]